MPVIYGGNDVIPAPFFTIQRAYERAEDGRIKRKYFSMSLMGKIVAYLGSPDSTGTWWNGGVNNPPPQESIPAVSRLASLRSKEGAIMAAFAVDGQTLEIQPLDGSAVFKCQARILKVKFDEGPWTDTVHYSIEMECDTFFWGSVEGGGGISGVLPEEAWAIEIANESLRTYRISHTVSSQQRATLDSNGNITTAGWQNAKAIVTPFLGSGGPATSLLPPLASAGYVACNYTRSQQIDEGNGRYAVTENWVYVPLAPAYEEFNVRSRYQEGRSQVTVEGTITGLALSSTTENPLAMQEEKYNNAAGVFAILQAGDTFVRAQNYSGLVLNPVLLTQTVGKNPLTGVITYTAEYDDRPISMIPGSISETFSFNNQNPSDIFASLIILGRIAGPILQGIGTVSSRSRTVNLEVVMPPWIYGGPEPTQPNTTAIFLGWLPSFITLFTAKDDETFVPRTGRYTRTVTWTYET